MDPIGRPAYPSQDLDLFIVEYNRSEKHGSSCFHKTRAVNEEEALKNFRQFHQNSVPNAIYRLAATVKAVTTYELA